MEIVYPHPPKKCLRFVYRDILLVKSRVKKKKQYFWFLFTLSSATVFI